MKETSGRNTGGNKIDIITKKTYKDFELVLEWKVSPIGNSGIFYFATEEGDYIWQTAPEMQVLDNTAHHDGKRNVTSAGALYDLIAPTQDVSKKVGEFNEARIIVRSNQVEHWLNGTKILNYEHGSNEVRGLIANKKVNGLTLRIYT